MKSLIFAPLAALRAGFDRLFAPTDSTSYDAMLKDDYHSEAILNSLQDENPILNWMETEIQDQDTVGRKRIIPKRVGRNWSVGSIGAKGALPQAGRASFASSEVSMRDVYMRVGIDRWTMNKSRNNKGAFAQALALEMKTAVEDVAFRRNVMACLYGSGVLAQVNGTHSGVTTLEVEDPGNVTGTVMPNRYLHGDSNSGMFIAVLDGSTPTTIKGTATITAANVDGTDVTVDTALTAADSDLVVIAQSATQNSYGKEPEGLLAAVDDGTYVATYHNLARATYPLEKAHVISSVGALSLDAIQQAIDGVSIKVGGAPDLLAMEHGVARALMALLETDRRYVGKDLMRPDGGTARAKKPGGKGAITYGDIPVLVERDLPYGMIFGLRKDTFLRLQWPDTGWADEGGGVLKWVDGYDEYTAFWRLFENYHCLSPVKNFRMDGVTTSQLTVRSF